MLDGSVLHWQEEMDVTASLLGPVSFPPFVTVTGHILLEYSSNVSCPTHLANAALTLRYTLRRLLRDLLWMRTQRGKITPFISPAQRGFSSGNWMEALVCGCTFPLYGLVSSAVIFVSGSLRLELGGGYLSHSLWLYFLSCFVNSEQLNPEKIRQFWKTVITYLF